VAQRPAQHWSEAMSEPYLKFDTHQKWKEFIGPLTLFYLVAMLAAGLGGFLVGAAT